MKPLINWLELQDFRKPPPPPQTSADGENPWDGFASMYNQMAAMEETYTLNQINCFGTSASDTVLDIGCGPGRITVPMAKRASSVTGIDTSELMMGYCRANVKAAGLSNVVVRNLDWEKANSENLEKHDIVIACRSIGMNDIPKLASFANKYVVLIAWANADSIPDVLADLFRGADGRDYSPQRPRDRRVGYNAMWNIAYDYGFDPNIRIVPDGFTKDYLSREEAYSDLIKLGSVIEGKMGVFRDNVDRLLSPNGNGFTFRRETKSYVIWFSPIRNQ